MPARVVEAAHRTEAATRGQSVMESFRLGTQLSSKDYVRQRAAIVARGLPPKPDWLPDGAARDWRLLWFGRGSGHFRAAWFDGPSDKKTVRLILSRALCCGWEESACARLVEDWLHSHGVGVNERRVFLAVDFYRELDVVRQYLGRRGVLENAAEKHRLQEVQKAERWLQRTATRVLRFLADHPGCKRAEVQRALGIKADALKRQLQRLERDGMLERGDVQGRYRATEAGQRFLARLDGWRDDLERGKVGTSCV